MQTFSPHSKALRCASQAGPGNPVELSGLAHELRNTIAPLANALEVIGCANADPRVAARMVVIAQRQVRQMSRLVRDLLDAGRLANGIAELELVQTTVQDLVEEAVRAWSHAATLRGHSLELTTPVLPLHVLADPLRMQQVLGNLLANAIKYTPPGGRIRVRVSRHQGRGEIRVCDNGIGIDPAQLERMFEPFRQDPRARALCRDGLGLGLSIARRLVELQGGTLSAHSAGCDSGSTFTVSLPLRAGKP